MRLDQKVVELRPELSRAYSSRLIERGKVKVSGQIILKPSFKVSAGDQVEIDDEAISQVVPKLKLPVLYEDDDCVVINKPPGILSHSKGAFNPEATVATWLADRAPNLSGERAGIVHRLDRSTSGVMICAKNQAALNWLQKQFAERKVKKIYLAIVKGKLEPDQAIIEMPIERNPKAPATFRIGPNGKPAVTQYKVLKAGTKYSLLELQPTTGRTHQLRVHLAAIGKPIVGDNLYGGQSDDRLYLHAWQLELVIPNRKRQIFTARRPASFLAKIKS